MIDVQSPIREAYVTALDGHLTAKNGFGKTVNVPVLDNVAGGQKAPYVGIREQTVTQDRIATGCSLMDATILLEIVTEYQSDLGGREQADLIASQIYARIPSALPGEIAGLMLEGVRLQMDYSPPKEAGQTVSFFRRLLRFRNALYS
jgi:hypothetical protein